MVHIDTRRREIIAKVVYYGPGLSGKTSNLAQIHAKAPETTRGELVSVNTEADRTLYFDFLPMDLGQVAGMRVRLQLYTVPGQVYYNATRKLVLQNVDGVVFVTDSARARRQDNLASLVNLHENMAALGQPMEGLPLVLQYNKRDLPDAVSLADLDHDLNPTGKLPRFEATANAGGGVFQTLKAITQAVVQRVQADEAGRISSRVGRTPTATPALPPVAEAAEAAEAAEELVAATASETVKPGTGRARRMVTVMAPPGSGPFRVLDRTPPTGLQQVPTAAPAPVPEAVAPTAQLPQELQDELEHLHLRLEQLDQGLAMLTAGHRRLRRYALAAAVLAVLAAILALI